MRNVRPAIAPLLAPLLALALLLGAPAVPAAGDSVVAGALLAQARKAMGSRKYEDAVALFHKAWTEDPNLVEAVYWKAQALEKMKDAPAALAAYRDFLALVEKKKAAGGTNAEEEKLRAQAAKRVESLAVSETEFRNLEAKYVAEMLTAMRGFVAKNASAGALEAAGRVLEVAPTNAEALAVKKKLAVPEPKDAGPFAGVLEWTDVLGEKLFPASESVVYGNGTVALDVKSSGKLRPRPGVNFTSDFGYDAEFRVADPYSKDWNVGIVFGDTSDGYFSLNLKSGGLSLLFGSPRAAPATLGDVILPGIDAAAWHSLGVVSRGNVVQAWLDGKKQLEATITQRSDATGEIGVQLTACRAEWRRVRAGRIQ